MWVDILVYKCLSWNIQQQSLLVFNWYKLYSYLFRPKFDHLQDWGRHKNKIKFAKSIMVRLRSQSFVKYTCILHVSYTNDSGFTLNAGTNAVVAAPNRVKGRALVSTTVNCFVQCPINSQLTDKLLYCCYMFRHYCVIFRELVVSILLS